VGADYYETMARTALVDLALAEQAGEREACGRLASSVARQEHAVVRLRAETRIVACQVWVDGVGAGGAAVRLAALADEADASGLFEAAYDATELRAHVLAHAGRDAEALETLRALNARVDALGWRRAGASCLSEPPRRGCLAAAGEPGP
jgi:hypothetical protein